MYVTSTCICTTRREVFLRMHGHSVHHRAGSRNVECLCLQVTQDTEGVEARTYVSHRHSALAFVSLLARGCAVGSACRQNIGGALMAKCQDRCSVFSMLRDMRNP